MSLKFNERLLMIGKTIAHYEVLAKIGQGGMGEVYSARDSKLGREVALKVLPADMARDPERLRRFEREARAVAALKHPNIVTIYSVEESDGLHFLTMELVEGKALSRILPKGGHPLERLFDIAIPLVDALSSAHAGGITHRDLKPDNIMIDADGRLRVLDFGLAKLQDRHDPGNSTLAMTIDAVTEEGKILGTAAYMSPEQAEGKVVDSRTDIFSLGTILYEMATGARPFQGETGMSVLGSILKDDPPAVTESNPSLPRHLGWIILRCLAKEPDRRYQTALDLRNELEELKKEIASGVHSERPAGSRVRTKGGSRLWMVLGLGAVLGFALAFAVMRGFRTETQTGGQVSKTITSALGQDADLNWSPESEFLAFGRLREGQGFDLMVKPVAGGEAVVRVEGPGDETVPRWSPDGRFLAYLSTSEPGSFIHLIPPHGGTPRKLIATDIHALDIDPIENSMGDRPWSSDSRTLLVSRVTATGQMAVYRVDRDSGEAAQLTFPPPGSDDMSPSFSFAGDRIVFARRIHGRGKLMTVSPSGGEPVCLLEEDFNNRHPVFRPDGRRLLFDSDRTGGRNIWELDLETDRLKQLTFETRFLSPASVSATDRIVYVPWWHDTFLYEVDVATGAQRQLTSHTKENYGARVSPDGRTIAYHSTRMGACEVFLLHNDGTPETRLTDAPGDNLYPDWSPDGQQLVFCSNRDGDEYRLYVMNRDGGGTRLLVDQPLKVKIRRTPLNGGLVSRWSPDGARIAYLATTDETTSLWVIDSDGGNPRESIADVEWFDWHPDNRHMIISRRRGSESEMFAVNLDSGQERTLLVAPLMELDVAPDGSAVSFCFGRGHMSMGLAILKLAQATDSLDFPHAAGEPEYVVPAEGSMHVHNGGWSADSQSLVYTRDQDYGDIYELVENR
jgi:Tol biopolymer transport system component/tRNA A-37 threonylcarbamoyl transferase component Bud32